ncbi:uncharacterized protein LOC141686289 [Apium graveolens]|uniref:uncharacterized protein LOC141686289 n=1 Tax=Apium graveolens TaxID=4045 RepID=UPI003D79C927
MFDHEKCGGTPQPRGLMEGFRNVVNECALTDLGFSGNEFTWERSRGTPNWMQIRLDRGLENSAWQRLFPRAEVKVLEVSTSDHLPLFLELNQMVYVPDIKRFRFENCWVREDQCSKIVKDSWIEADGWNIMKKMEYVSLKLEEWGGGLVQELRNQIKKCRTNMQRLRSRRERYGIQQYEEARDLYLKLLEKQEVYWKQRSK